MDAMKQLKIAKNGYILMSVLFMILGACLIIWPDCSMAVFCTAVGIMLIVYGLIKILGYFSIEEFIKTKKPLIVWRFSLILPLECCWQQWESLLLFAEM